MHEFRPGKEVREQKVGEADSLFRGERTIPCIVNKKKRRDQ